jgi:hypothetical protein
MSSYHADFKYTEGATLAGTVAPIYAQSFQTIKIEAAAEQTETGETENYDESTMEEWPPSPNEAAVPPTSNMFTPFVPPYGANECMGYPAFMSTDGGMFPGIPADSQGVIQAGLQLNQSRMDEQLRLQQLTEYRTQLAAAQTLHTQVKEATPSATLAQPVQPPQLQPADSQGGPEKKASDPPPETASSESSPPPAATPAVSESVSRRQAHNLVERKYRDTLNGELVRLRQAIPHIRDLDAETPEGRSRASKATVLAAAADYITRLLGEVEGLTEENALLRVQAGFRPPAAVEAEDGEGGVERGRGGGARGAAVGRRQRGKRG